MTRLEGLVVQLEERALELGMVADLDDLELQELRATHTETLSALCAALKYGEPTKSLAKRLEAVRVELVCIQQRHGEVSMFDTELADRVA